MLAKQDLVNKFRETRDIPYSIPLSMEEVNSCCSGKCVRLKALFEDNGYKVKYRVVDFSWDDLNLPTEVLAIAHQKVSTHVYLEVLIDGKWVNVDPTWDSEIASELPVAEWDGQSDTILAVPVEKYYDDEESVLLMQPNKEEFEKDIEVNGKFYQAINEWLEKDSAKLVFYSSPILGEVRRGDFVSPLLVRRGVGGEVVKYENIPKTKSKIR